MASPSISGTADPQFAEGLHFSAFHSYIVGGEDKAMEHVTITDIKEPAATVVL